VFEPAKEQFDLPAVPIQFGDDGGAAMTDRDQRRTLVQRWFNAPASPEREAALRALMASPDPSIRVAELLAL
jgi:hypothetical protein